jgi:hypothetical protein
MGNGPIIGTDGTVSNALAGVPMATHNADPAPDPNIRPVGDSGAYQYGADPTIVDPSSSPFASITKPLGNAARWVTSADRNPMGAAQAQTPPLNVTTDAPRGNPSYVQPNRDSDTSGDASVLPGAGQYTQGRAQPGIASGNMDATAMVGKAQTNADGMTDDQRNNAPFLEQQRQMADNSRVQNAADAMGANDFKRTQGAEYARQNAGILAGQMDSKIAAASGRERRMLMEQKQGLIQQSMATPGEGPNLIARAQEVNAGGNSAAAGRQNIVSNAIKQQSEKQGVQKGAYDLQGQARMQTALDAMHNAKTPQEAEQARQNVLIMGGHNPDEWDMKTIGGKAIVNADGTTTVVGGYGAAINKRTGQVTLHGQQGSELGGGGTPQGVKHTDAQGNVAYKQTDGSFLDANGNPVK